MKKIIMSLAIIAAVGAVIVGGTTAYFSDTETSSGNVFTAGSVSIGFGGISHVYGYDGGVDPFDGYFETSSANNIPFFAFNDMKPRDAGTLTFGLGNGANDAYVCGLIGGDVEPTSNPDLALYENLNFYENGVTTALSPGQWIDLGMINANDSGSYAIDYCFGDWDGTTCNVDPGVDYNDAQGGSFEASLTLFAIQARNNEDFSCDQLTLVGGEPVYTQPEIKVGASLTQYIAPTCDVTVSGSQSVQTAVSSLTSGGTVCVADDYDMLGDDSYITISNNNVTLAAVTQGTALDVPVKINADNVTVTGFKGAIGYAAGGNAAFYIGPGSDNFEIIYNEVYGGAGAGVMTESGATYSSGLIANNILDGATQGMYLNPFTGGTITVEYNDISNNVAGIGGYNGAIVRYNEFTHTTAGSEAIGIDGSFDANPGVINYNNFLDGTKINTYAGLTSTVDAKNNFFSTNGTTQVDTTNGPVDYTPEASGIFTHN